MKLNFSKKTYAKEAIKKTISDYNGLADFEISDEKGNIIVSFSNIDDDIQDVIKDEFANHVLAYMKNLKPENKNE